MLRKTNLPIKEIADQLEVSVGSVYKWKSGENSPQKHFVNKLAEIEKENIRWISNTEIQVVDGDIPESEMQKVNQYNRIIASLLDDKDKLLQKVKELEEKIRLIE